MSLNLREQLHTERKLFHTKRLLRRDAAQCGGTCGGMRRNKYILRRSKYILRRDDDDLMSDKYITLG